MRQIGALAGDAPSVDAPVEPSPTDIGERMTPEEAVALHRNFFEVILNGRRLDMFATTRGPKFVAHGVYVPDGMTSAQAARAQFLAAFEAFPDLHFTVEDAFSDGEYSVVRWTATGTHLGEWQGIPPTGKSVKVGGIVMARVGGGVFHERWDTWDEVGLLKQLGVLQLIHDDGQTREGTERE
jgi:predicted ester cyclase